MLCRLSLVLSAFYFASFFVFMLSLKRRPLVQSLFVLQYACISTTIHSCFVIFPFFWNVVFFPSIFLPLPFFSLYGEYAARSPLPGGVFLPCDHLLEFFYISILCENSIIQSITEILRSLGLRLKSLELWWSLFEEYDMEWCLLVLTV